MRPPLIVAAVLASLVNAASAQRLPPLLAASPTPHVTAQRPDSVSHADEGAMVLAGLGAGFLGAYAGAWLGTRGCGGEDGCLVGLLEGAAVGEAAGVGLGVHLGNRGRGNLAMSVLASGAIMGAGILIGSSACRRDPCGSLMVFSIPIVQLAASISLEELWTRRPNDVR